MYCTERVEVMKIVRGGVMMVLRGGVVVRELIRCVVMIILMEWVERVG